MVPCRERTLRRSNGLQFHFGSYCSRDCTVTAAQSFSTHSTVTAVTAAVTVQSFSTHNAVTLQSFSAHNAVTAAAILHS